MTTTDADAQHVLQSYVAANEVGPLTDAIRHALQAIEDRAALVEACNRTEWSARSDAARRHIKGEP
jgi:hypothetical protein